MKLPERGGKQIALVDLATHASGLPLRPTNLLFQRSSTNDKYRGYTADLMCECLSSSCPHYAISGRKCEYSNLGHGLLGHVLEKRMGATYPELVESRITQPLGMGKGHPHPDHTPAMKSRMAAGLQQRAHAHPGRVAFRRAAKRGSVTLHAANDLLKFFGLSSAPSNFRYLRR